MKEMSHTTHADAKKRVQECKNLLDMFSQNEKCVEAMKEWQIKIVARVWRAMSIRN